MHISARGIIRKDDGIILIHRIKQTEAGKIRDYYVIPGGKQEIGESIEDTLNREIKEELGIQIKPIKKIIEFNSKYDDSIQDFYICEYISGIIGTGNGPEFTDKINYKGKFDIEIIDLNNIKNINLVPNEIKDKIIEEINKYYA